MTLSHGWSGLKSLKRKAFPLHRKSMSPWCRCWHRSPAKSVEEMKKQIEETGSRDNIETELVLMNVKKFIYENAKIKKLKPVSYEEFIKKK